LKWLLVIVIGVFEPTLAKTAESVSSAEQPKEQQDGASSWV